MKRYVDYALDILESVLSDALARWPSLGTSLEKDKSYLRRVSKQRGLPFFTGVLPKAGRWLDRALDTGHLSITEGIPQGFPVIGMRPKLFGGLFLKVFDELGMLRYDADAEAVLFLRTILYGFKKVQVPHTASQLKETLDAFYDIEARLPSSHSCSWDSDIPTWEGRFGHPIWGVQWPCPSSDQTRFGFLDRDDDDQSDRFNWDHFRAFARFCVSALGTPDWWAIMPKHGPGAVAEGSQVVKYDFDNWPRKLQLYFPHDWFASGFLDMEPESMPSEKEYSSRLCAVPKTANGPRLICCEPVAHQWIQQGILQWLEGRLNTTLFRHSINLRSQELSKQRALDASIDGMEMTMDLSSASDRLSCRLVEYIFQGTDILDGMHACRTRTMTQNLSDEHPSMIVLKKFSTMGSALTFPIQSIVFTILCVYALRHTEKRTWNFDGVEEDFKRVRVYGDDIIAPTHAYTAIKLLLEECGLQVNADKTYTGKYFRESCGCDAFRGVDVTPPRILQLYDGSPSSTATLIETSNNFHKKGMWKTAEKIVSYMPEAERKLLLVHNGEGMGLGLYSFVGPRLDHLKAGWDRDLQRSYSIALGVTSKVTQRQGTGFAGCAQYFHEHPDPLLLPYERRQWVSGQPGRARLKKGRVRVYE
nr:MAG: hypothetical protein 3 [Leviviridae sp.]